MISLLRQEEAFHALTLIQYRAGGKRINVPRKRKYREIDDRLQTLKIRLQNDALTPVEYGDAASHLLHIDLDFENKTPIDVFEARDWNLTEDNKTERTIQELIKVQSDSVWYNVCRSNLATHSKPETELRGLGLETTDDLKDVMKLGSFKCFWNRVYIVGPYLSGKSCLAKLLVGDALPRERESTDGIWIYMGRAGMDLNGEEWIVIPKGTAVQEILVSMMMSLSTCESLDTDNLTTRLQESDKNLHDSEVSRNSGHVEVLLLENSAQRKVHEERISKNHPMESCNAHDYTITPCLSNENAHINDTENESKLQTVILTELNGSTVHGKNAFEEPTNAKQGIPLKRTRKTIVADTASHAHGVCVAAINTPRLCPVKSRTSDVDELEHSPTEIPQKKAVSHMFFQRKTVQPKFNLNRGHLLI
ncbi:Hypothetical predicted protein [Mytilus galloprovincialis]|uniref:Uncharacterized protein n=1 Tax=Mytilus galloprovincialis TaxID=29158 RepID=A0A8B6GPF9_MYTGA|nr:Hypothetical predicted protein [Mytilus galloprovincialis]